MSVSRGEEGGIDSPRSPGGNSFQGRDHGKFVLKRSRTISKSSNGEFMDFFGEDTREVQDIQSGYSVKVAKKKMPGQAGSVRRRMHSILADSRFDACIGVVIIMNSITIGVEQTFRMQNRHDIMDICSKFEAFFLAVYTVELGTRFFAHGTSCLDSSWVKFDFVLVMLGLLSAFLETLIALLSNGNEREDLASMLGPLMVLRVLRLARLARAIRLVAQFKELWMLVRGLLSSARTMVYTFCLIAIILYVFACLGMEIITSDITAREDPEFDRYVERYFPNIWISMLTLMQFVTMDSIAIIYTPLIQKSPGLAIFFIIIIMIVPISLMNLVTAVIVEGSFEQAKQDADVQRAYKNNLVVKMIPRIESMFRQMDADGNGDISLEEILNAPPELAEELATCFETDNMTELFEILDVNQNGSVSIDEFCQELVTVVVSERSIDQVRIQKSLISLRNVVHDMRNQVTSQQDEIKAMRAMQDDMKEMRAMKDDLKAIRALLGKHLKVSDTYSQSAKEGQADEATQSLTPWSNDFRGVESSRGAAENTLFVRF